MGQGTMSLAGAGQSPQTIAEGNLRQRRIRTQQKQAARLALIAKGNFRRRRNPNSYISKPNGLRSTAVRRLHGKAVISRPPEK